MDGASHSLGPNVASLWRFDMPMYVYVCPKCGYEFEEISSVSDGEERLKDTCLDCGARLKRPITSNKPTVHLRGYSPAHPRFFRGMRDSRKKKQ